MLNENLTLFLNPFFIATFLYVYCYFLNFILAKIVLNVYTFTCGQTPSTTSTTTMAPSQRRTAVETSPLKSTCPGESITFTRYSSSVSSVIGKHPHQNLRVASVYICLKDKKNFWRVITLQLFSCWHKLLHNPPCFDLPLFS